MIFNGYCCNDHQIFCPISFFHQRCGDKLNKNITGCFCWGTCDVLRDMLSIASINSYDSSGGNLAVLKLLVVSAALNC